MASWSTRPGAPAPRSSSARREHGPETGAVSGRKHFRELLGLPHAKAMVAWHGFGEAAQAGSDDAGAECILVSPDAFNQLLGSSDPVEEVVDRADDDAAVIIYTSGTTGTPKGATLMHSNLADGAREARELVDAFLQASFDGGERYVARLRKVEQMEKEMKHGKHLETS